MSEIQDIFDDLILSGYYGPSGFPYMCVAANVARMHYLITYAEEDAIGKEIAAFLLFLGNNNSFRSTTLTSALQTYIPEWASYGLKAEYMMKIYQNWDNRFEILKEIQDKIGLTKD